MTCRTPVLCSVAPVAAALAVATPVAASASTVYTAALSGSYVQQWQVHDPSADCVGGGGTQTVQFRAVPHLLVTGSTEDDGGNPYAGGRPWHFGLFKVTGTITRTDTTAVPATPDCDGDPPVPVHDCGGPRSFTIDNAYIYKSRGASRARLHLELSGLNELPGRMFANTDQCYRSVLLDITTTASWKVQLRSKCHAAPSRSPRCG